MWSIIAPPAGCNWYMFTIVCYILYLLTEKYNLYINFLVEDNKIYVQWKYLFYSRIITLANIKFIELLFIRNLCLFHLVILIFRTRTFITYTLSPVKYAVFNSTHLHSWNSVYVTTVVISLFMNWSSTWHSKDILWKPSTNALIACMWCPQTTLLSDLQ